MSGEQWREAIESATRSLALTIPANKHGQLCPVWTRRNRGPVPLTACNCWIVANARHDATIAITAAAPQMVADTRREIAEAITDNVRNADFAKQDRGGYHGFTECMAYVAGHDKAAAIALGSDNTDPSAPADDYPLVPSAADRWLDHGPREGGAS